MNKFEKQLERWNNGILRGAQAKLAKCLQVTTATVALWATGKRHPSKGYIAQMARLFFMDEYSVARLFTPANDWAEFDLPTPTTWMLRDEDSPILATPTPKEKVVSLPVFTKLPPTYPRFLSKQTKGWWTIPVSWAKKTGFLFLLPTSKDPERLLFVEPCSTWKEEKIMLGKQGNTYLLLRVEKNKNQFVLCPEQGPSLSTGEVVPVGMVTKCIGKMKITP